MLALGPGSTLSHYRILSALGAGGMGEVYRAEDSKLERVVALKVLPERFASDEDRLRRFIREAKTASGINHPNVAHIYEIGEENNCHFIAMELVEGITLDAKIKEGALKTTELLDTATQIADALQAAHARGVIHRDLKPANIMINANKQVKVLDFGLAKTSTEGSLEQGTQMATVSHTEPGLVLGTVPHMSPEQALGRSVDARSDLFSLGSILYELCAGRRPFSGNTSGEMIGQITHAQPAPLSRFSYDVPAEFERIVRKCLEKDPEDRYQTAKELLIDLRNLRRDTISGATASGIQPQVVQYRPGKTLLAIAALAVLLTAGGFFYWKYHSRPTIRSIAVLPFVNRSNNQNLEYLSDGITDSTINDLSQVNELRVIARPTVFTYKGKAIDPQKVGRDLNVDGIVTGSITENSGNIVVQADLINVAEGAQIWGGQFSGGASDILRLQNEVSKQVSENLRLRLTGKERQQISKQYTENSDAYRFYLKGRFFWNKISVEGAEKSIQYFQQAIEQDPGYALAYSGLSDAYVLLAMYGSTANDPCSTCKAAALKAVELDPQLESAHASLGTYYMFCAQQWKDAEREFLLASTNPNFAYAHWIFSYYYGATGNTEEAVKKNLYARSLDPLSVPIAADTGFVYYLNRDFQRADIEERKALEMDPNFEAAYGYHLYILYELKEYQKAIEAAEKAIAISNRSPYELAGLGYILGRMGEKAQAQEILSELKKRSETSYISPYLFGLISIGLDQKDDAFRLIRQACEEHTGDWGLFFLKSDPVMDPIRSDPRFADLLKCMNLQP
jgi:serine/threonine protein kinase/tetratricopeptide (TPR) repeat protein